MNLTLKRRDAGFNVNARSCTLYRIYGAKSDVKDKNFEIKKVVFTKMEGKSRTMKSVDCRCIVLKK